MGGLLCKAPSSSSEKQHVKPKGTVSDTDRAVLDLKNARDKLSRYRSQLDKDSSKLLSRAKALNDDGNKTMALTLLKLRKHKLNEMTSVENQLLNVLQMVDTISSKENERDMLTALQNGKEALQHLHDEMSIDSILDLMEEVHEQGKVEEEINAILGSGGAELTSVQEEEIEKELEALQEQMKDEAEMDVGEKLPEVPTKPMPQVEVEEPAAAGKKKVEEPTAARERVAVPAS